MGWIFIIGIVGLIVAVQHYSAKYRRSLVDRKKRIQFDDFASMASVETSSNYAALNEVSND
ncbi:MAG: hypothetical protein COA78_21985 [Blastopirellula sp.]|nr:MAG: hypothetical protein COA78_21985 [Blastopirellula sp.]